MTDDLKGYLYYPGCSLKSTGRAYEESFLTLFKKLDIHLQEIDDWNCCGATSYMAIDEIDAFSLSARTIALASKSIYKDIIAPCNACYLGLKKTVNYINEYPSIGKEIEEKLKVIDMNLNSIPQIRHPLDVIYDDIGIENLKSKLVRKWQGGNIACYYGCQIVRPFTDIDDPHYPTKMDQILNALGVPTIDYALKTKCCGGALIGTVHDVGVRLNYILLKEMKRKGAEAVVTICPLCQFNLDTCQGEIRGKEDKSIDLPILYFTQILGWLLGGEYKELGLHRGISGSKVVKNWFKNSELVKV